MGILPPNSEADLRQLTSAVEHLLGQESFGETVARLGGDLARSEEPFVWATLDLKALPCRLPPNIQSGWMFHLRAGVPSGAHYHPNSVQHMALIRGRGTFIVGGVRGELRPFTPGVPPGAELWLVIDRGVPHEFFPVEEDMTVVSFHTCLAEDLEEVACETGGTRRYEAPR